MRLCNPVTFGLAWLIVVAIVAVALIGCAVEGGDAKYRSGDDHIASIQTEAASAKWEMGRAKTTHGPAREAHDESAYKHVENIQQHASGAALDFTDAAKAYGKLVKDTDAKYAALNQKYNSFGARWGGWMAWRWFWASLAVISVGVIAFNAMPAAWLASPIARAVLFVPKLVVGKIFA